MPIKTGFSFNAAVGNPKDVASRMSEIGWGVGPICDRGGTHGHVRWMRACKEYDLRPVFGVELGVSADKTAAKPIVDHWTFIARDSMRQLNDLIYLATSCPRGEPLLTYQEASRCGLIKIAHERTNADEADWSSTLLGLSPATPSVLYRRAIDMGATAVAVPRNVYPREGDLEFYRVALGQYKSSTQTYPQWIVSDPELAKSLSWFVKDSEIADAIDARRAYLASSTAALTKAELIKPHRPDTLEAMCRSGAEKTGVDLLDPPYRDRMERELEMIEQKKFSDYFYLLAEMVNWAKERMVVGPARGSSCGSLVCYLLGITAIDPLRHGLLFERFIDVTRADLPDVDLDFSEAKRDEVFAHIEQLYPCKVARLGNINMFGIKSALNQVGITLRIPQGMIDAVAETAIKRKMGDSRRGSVMGDSLTDTDSGRRMLEKYPESVIVSRLEGHPHNPSRHAAGMVATQGDILDYVAVDARTGGTMCDKYDAEELNLLKVDVLGLTQLTIFERAMVLTGVDPVSGWHEKIPLDDQAAFAILNTRKFCGVFQFEGAAMRGLAMQIKFESLDDIVAAGALVRPGPMVSGNTEKWVCRRAGKEKAQYMHPLLEPYLRETYGIPVYQEQVLQIGREVGDLSWAEVTALRKAMSKSLGKEYFDQFGDKWKASAVAKGMPEDVAAKFWDEMCQFGAWAFNLSHSVAYGYVSYWCCWWKAHHPIEYACACLDMQADPAKQIEILKELASEDIEYVAVDVAKSGDSWLPFTDEHGKKKVLGPLSNVVGVGPSKRAVIMKCREEGTPLPNGLAKMMANPRTLLDSLSPIEQWVKKTYPNGELASKMNIVSRPTPIGTIEVEHGDVLAIVTPDRILPKDENEPAKVAQRGYEVNPSKSLVVFFKDDSGEILAKVGPKLYESVGKEIAERGRVGKAVYAVRGRVGKYRMIWVDRVRYLGDM